MPSFHIQRHLICPLYPTVQSKYHCFRDDRMPPSCVFRQALKHFVGWGQFICVILNHFTVRQGIEAYALGISFWLPSILIEPSIRQCVSLCLCEHHCKKTTEHTRERTTILKLIRQQKLYGVMHKHKHTYIYTYAACHVSLTVTYSYWGRGVQRSQAWKWPAEWDRCCKESWSTARPATLCAGTCGPALGAA